MKIACKISRVAGLTILSLAASSCDDATEASAEPAAVAAVETSGDPGIQVEGFPPYRLNMTLDEVLAESAIRWPSIAVQACRQNLPLKPCWLATFDAAVPIEGIPFKPRFAFDKRGRLINMNLSYDRYEGITRDECLELHARSLDHLNENLAPTLPQDRALPNGEMDSSLVYRTPANAEFRYTRLPDGGLIAHPSYGGFTPLRAVSAPNEIGKPYLVISSSGVRLDGNLTCSISIRIESGAQEFFQGAE